MSPTRHDLKRDIQFNTRVTGAEFDEAAQPVDGAHRQGRDGHRALPHRRRRQPVGDQHAAVQGPRYVQGQVVPHQPLPARAASISPASGSPSSAPAPPRCRPSPRSRSRPSNSPCSSAPPTTACRRATARSTPRSGQGAQGRLRRHRQAHPQIVLRPGALLHPKSVLETTPEEREREFDRMWDAGGFAFWLANYQDMFFDQAGQRPLRRLPQAQDPLTR